jgi:hypothetical protein
VPRKLHDHRVVNPRLPHVGVEGMAQIMKPEVDYSCLTTGIGKSLLDLLEGFSPVREDSIVIQGSYPPGNSQYIISPTAKEDNPWL